MTSLSFDAALDFDALDGATIELTSEQIWQAGVDKKNWAEYLETLAQIGLEAWFAEQHLTARLIEGDRASNRWMTQGFQVQGLMVSAAEEEFVSVKGTRDPAHFYILTQVAEEQGQVKVSGFVRSELFQ